MHITGFHNFSIQQKTSTQKSFKGASSPVEKSAASVELPKVGVDTMKAYSGISTKDEFVSKEKLFDYLKQSGVEREDMFELIAQSLADKNGEISQSAFDFLQSFQEKRYSILQTMKIFDSSKVDGEIDYNALKIADKLIEKTNSTFYGKKIAVSAILDKSKNQDGTFNQDVLDLISANSDVLKKFFVIRQDNFFNTLKNNSKEFSKQNLDYAKQRTSENVDILKILNEIAQAKDNDGNFSLAVRKLKDEVNSNFDEWTKNLVLSIATSFSETEKDKRDVFIETAKSYKNNKDFNKVLSFVKQMKSDENDKSSLDYDKKSFDFVYDMLKSSYFDSEALLITLKNIGIPYDKLSDKEIAALKKLLMSVEKNDIEVFLDAAKWKVGDKKGQFSFENLEKYLDIYSKNKMIIDKDYISHLAGCFSLEQDDRALSLFNKLHNLRWTKKVGSIETKEMLDKKTLDFLLGLLCLEKGGKATRPCLPNIIEKLEKLLSMELPMSSKDAFENFLLIQDFDAINKLEKVNFAELGIKTGQISTGVFKSADEKQLLKFKEYLKTYLKDKDPKSVDINLNSNISTVVELTTGNSFNKTILFYDIAKGEPTAEMNSSNWNNRVTKYQKDFQKNTISKQRFSVEKDGPFGMYEYNNLEFQEFVKYDKNGNLVFTETMEKSPVNNVFNVKKVYSDGKVEDICKATKTPKGNDLIEKHMASFDGTKTDYRYEDDVNGNRIIDYKITDKNGKVLMNRSITFEVVDDNHFISSINNKKFDIQIKGNELVVKNLQNDKIAVIDLINFTKSSQEKILPLLKQLPGDELFAMKELNLSSFAMDDRAQNAAYSPDLNSIMFKEKYLDLGVALHEWGHAKDELMFKEINESIFEDPVLLDIYNEEKKAFRENFNDAQLEHVGYFAADYHYLGRKRAIKEGIAETNTILNTCPKNEVQAVRSQYWQQYFPRTIAYLSSLLN